MWEIILVPELASWLADLDEGARVAILQHVGLLAERGPQLGRPYADTLEGSSFPNMKELRVQFRGDPYRVLFAFDPARRAILLVGGNKRGDARWYKVNLPVADARFRAHLDTVEG